jgi:hypothetical protein
VGWDGLCSGEKQDEKEMLCPAQVEGMCTIEQGCRGHWESPWSECAVGAAVRGRDQGRLAEAIEGLLRHALGSALHQFSPP